MPVQAADKHHIGEAWKLYRQLIAADPTREVALLYNHQLEQWAVVQGGPGSVPTLDAIRLLGWKVADTSLARHSHPVGPGGVASEPNLLPSNRRGDLELVRSDAHKGDPLAAAYMSAIDVMIDRGSGPQPDRTFLFYDRKTNMWTVDYPVAGKHGGRARVSFVSMGQYRRWFQGRFHFSPDIPANATNPAAPSRQSPSGPPKKPANEFEENSPTDVDAKPYGASQGPRIAATTVRDLAVDMESLLKVGGTKTIPTAEGMLFRYVQVARQGSNLAVRRLEAVLPPSQRGQGLGTQLVEAFEEAAVSVARANGLKTVTINVGVFTNESWRLRMEARGYVYTPTEGAWIKTIEFQPLPLLQRIGRRLLR
jgi:GNAT superfamily N-acetyltransferase